MGPLEGVEREQGTEWPQGRDCACDSGLYGSNILLACAAWVVGIMTDMLLAGRVLVVASWGVKDQERPESRRLTALLRHNTNVRDAMKEGAAQQSASHVL